MRRTGSWEITRCLPSAVPPENRSIIGVAMIPGHPPSGLSRRGFPFTESLRIESS
jgi:hypothetical protein